MPTRGRSQRPASVAERSSSRLRGLPPTSSSPTPRVVRTSSLPASQELSIALPGATSAVQTPLPPEVVQVSPSSSPHSVQEVFSPRESLQGTAQSLYFDSYLEVGREEELSYSELIPGSDNSFSSVTEVSILERAELTLVGLHSTAVMTGVQPSFASVQKSYQDAFIKCQFHAKKLPLTELDYARPRESFHSSRDLLTQLNRTFPTSQDKELTPQPWRSTTPSPSSSTMRTRPSMS